LLPFLHGELNLNKLDPVGSPLVPALPHSPESDAEQRSQRREQRRSAQKIQRKMIMERLRPLVLASEDRFDYTDPAAPGLRVSLRTQIRLAYDDGMADAAPAGAGEPCLLKSVLEHGPMVLDGCANAEALPFAVIEVHLGDGEDQMPGWLAQVFFESALVHPVLDFDLYLHAIATFCPQHATGLPYWLVDCCRLPFATPPGSPVTAIASLCPSPAAVTCSPTPNYSMVDIPLRPSAASAPPSPPTEASQLLPAHHASAPGPSPGELRRTLSAALAAAVIVSVALTVWPCHQDVARIVVEMADLLAQWVGRLLQHIHTSTQHAL
ncbi:Phosphate metabolism transcription protein, partial [Coemansia spiralis]